MVQDSPAPPNFDLRGYPPLLGHVFEGRLYRPLLTAPDVAAHRKQWRELFILLAKRGPADRAMSDHFHTKWHESHHLLRELIDDDDLFVDVAKAWLPPYHGPTLTLYRGENIDRLSVGKIGSGWSDQEETAAMFARGLNAVGSGGALLRTHAPAAAIVAGPSDHSANWLREREFTVDPRMLGQIEQIRLFAPAS